MQDRTVGHATATGVALQRRKPGAQCSWEANSESAAPGPPRLIAGQGDHTGDRLGAVAHSGAAGVAGRCRRCFQTGRWEIAAWDEGGRRKTWTCAACMREGLSSLGSREIAAIMPHMHSVDP